MWHNDKSHPASVPSMKMMWFPQAIVILLLLWALYPHNPYGYYTLLRIVCCVVFSFLSYKAHARGNETWTLLFGITAIIYNPIVPLPLKRQLWSIVNIATIGLAVASIAALKNSTQLNKHGD
jgi:hypothetical protein